MPTIARERQIHANLQIGRPDGVTWTDVSDYLASATVELGDISGIGTGQSGVDGVVRRASFVLRNDRAGIPGNSFSPRDRQSAWNQFDVDGDGTPEYAPLLWPNREVVLRVRIDGPVGQGTTAVVDDLGMADGATSAFALSARSVAEDSETVTFKLPYRWTDYTDKTWAELTDRTWVDIKEEQELARGVDYTIDYEAGTIAFATTPEAGVFIEAEYGYWVTLFHGLLGDAIRTSGPTVTCDARDLAKRLQDTYILTPREYGSEAGTPAEDVIQQIIDDNLGAGEVTLYFPSGTASNPRPIAESPGFMVTPYVVEYMSVWDAIQQVAAQFGWFLGYRWHPNTGRMQLILMEPPRTKDATTTDFRLSWEDDIYTQDLEITDRDIRNIVTVTFRNSATGNRESVTVQDDTSIATYGPRAMQIEEGDASLIDTPEEAQRLANAALADLKDMTATTQLNLPLLPMLDVFSGIVVTDPRVSSTDDFFGVESVRHVLDFEARQFRTEVVAGGRVVGGHHRWLRMQTRPGAKSPIRRGDVTLPGIIAAPTNLRITSSGTEQVGQTITSYAVLAWDAPANYRAERYRLQVRRKGELDWSNAQEYDVSEPRQKVVAPGGLTYEARVRVTPFEAANADWSTTMEFTMPGDTQAPATPSGLTVVSHLRGVQASITPNTEPDLRHYIWEYRIGTSGSWQVLARDLVTSRVIPAEAGQTVQVRVSAEDWSGNVSAPTTAASAVAGRVETHDLEDGIVTTPKIAAGAITGLDVIQVNDTTGFSTTSTDPTDIPGFSITFTLTETATVFVMMRISARVTANPHPGDVKGFYWLTKDGVILRGQAIESGDLVLGGTARLWTSVVVIDAQQLAPGTHTYKGQIEVDTDFPESTVMAYTRELVALIFKR